MFRAQECCIFAKVSLHDTTWHRNATQTAKTIDMENKKTSGPSKVYFCPVITPDNLIKVYEALGRPAKGDYVCAKLSTGEAGNPNHLSTDIIKKLILRTGARIVECNTAYIGHRCNTFDHMQTAREHGFTAIAEVDIMDDRGDIELPVRNSRHLKGKAYVGQNWKDYLFTIVLSHFKGHPMAGFGGALKNVGIGMQSARGKAWVHTAGRSLDVPIDWEHLPNTQDEFLESMAEACEAVFDYAGDNIIFINVLNNLSIDCDCVEHPVRAELPDIGIMASLDPVALDRACVDQIINNPNPGKKSFIERMEQQHATHLLDYAEQLGLGTQQYELVNIEPQPLTDPL